MQDRIGVVTRCHKFSLGQAGVIVDGGKGVSKLRHGSSGWVKDSPDFLIALLWSIKFSSCSLEVVAGLGQAASGKRKWMGDSTNVGILSDSGWIHF